MAVSMPKNDYKLIKSPNFSKKMRNLTSIKFLIIHYTGMQSMRVSIDRLKSKKSKVSCHYLISRSGKVIKMVEENLSAWHSGKSRWKNIKNLNNRSIGIELVNKGHKIKYQKFPELQIKSLIKLCLKLKKKYKIKKTNILGHSDIAPLRKIDPGENFPWQALSLKNLGVWYPKLNFKKIFKNRKKTRNLFFKNIYKIGYRYFNLKKKMKSDKKIVKAFQRKFLPNKVNGNIDEKTLKISEYLSKIC